MVYWITGRKNSGKTTLAYKIAKQTNGVVLDGDEFRQHFKTGFSDSERLEHIKRISKIAMILEKQDVTVIIACVSPNKTVRKEIQSWFDSCIEIQLPYGELWAGTVYEE